MAEAVDKSNSGRSIGCRASYAIAACLALALTLDWAVLRSSLATSAVPGYQVKAHPVCSDYIQSGVTSQQMVNVSTVAIVRAVTGGIDPPHHSNLPNMWDYYGNKTNPLPFPRRDMDARLRAKFYKMLTHTLHPNYTALIWADGAFQLQPGFVEWMIGHLGDADAAFFLHPDRTTITDEMEYVYSTLETPYVKVRYSGEPMREQVQSYLHDGLVAKDAPLLAGGLFIRRNNDKVNRAFDHWYIENTKWSIQDQLSLPYVIQKHSLQVNHIPGNLLFKGPFHVHVGHGQLQ